MTQLHAAIAHFPIALLISSFLFAILAFTIRSEGVVFCQVFKWNLFLGTILSIAALASGLQKAKSLPSDALIHEMMGAHKTAGFIITIISIVLSVWIIIRNTKLKAIEIKSIVALLAVTVAIIVYSAHLVK